ncbi:3-phosphoserine/phosphohydroxythreonine aminotransferase [Thauera aromatica K172]|uniref:Phosphoserine aminotransferase n=2 Tax=Zoogloeaceae TaxID=2008794 RepID=A0A2R4BM06_THAAR|nr:3-phosphoserine/phosphohydroxythreonine aminotransferase [Thauera aromatica K172]
MISSTEEHDMGSNERAFNFSAGPGALPEEVLRQARDELLNRGGCGVSVAEMSHRGEHFIAIAEQAERDLRDLLAIPADHAVLFLQGGGSQQFAQVPLNLLPEGGCADYIDTGFWSVRAIEEARRYGRINIAASSHDDGYRHIPRQARWRLSASSAYVHYTANETIDGLEFDWIPEVGDTPLVADFSANILSRPLDVSRFALIYAGAQKNIGPSGLAVVIVRKDLLGRARRCCPTMLDYRIAAGHGSMYNTPPTFAWYLAGLIFRWLKAQGGLTAIAEINRRKQKRLYDTIDASGLYVNRVEAKDRSWMNVPFRLVDDRLDEAFLAGAEVRGLLYLKGHRATGGMRASLYNAVSEAAVDALVAYMTEFERERG